MTEHFTAEDISRWFAGERPGDLERHAVECAACSARLDGTGRAMAEFRGAVRDWSAAQPASVRNVVWRPSVRHLARRWILAAATVLILAAGPAYWHARRQAQAIEMARADALLEQVDAQISRAVPRTMEPLVSLVTWGNGPTDEKSQEKELQ